MQADAEIVLADLLRDVLAELRGLRSEVGRQRATEAGLHVRDAIRDYLGSEEFTVGMLMIEIERDPHGELSEAVSRAVNMNGSERSRSTALGTLLANTPGIECVRKRRGSTVYRVKVL